MFFVAIMLAATPVKSGALSVKASVPGAKVLLDDRPGGTVPVILRNIVAGVHRVRVKKLGYLAADATVNVQANATAEVTLDLLPYAGVLTVKAVPKGCQVFVDGKGVGVTPFEGEVAIGRRSVEVKKDGYITYRESFQAGAGEPYKIEANLQKGNDPGAGLDVPLVALAPKKKPVADDEIPLEALAKPRPAIDGDPGLVALQKPPPPWYQKWWVWGVVGGVVAAGVITAVVVTQTQGPQAPDFRWDLAERAPSR